MVRQAVRPSVVAVTLVILALLVISPLAPLALGSQNGTSSTGSGSSVPPVSATTTTTTVTETTPVNETILEGVNGTVPQSVKNNIMQVLSSYSNSSQIPITVEASVLWAIQGYWNMSGISPSIFGLDPANNHVFILVLNTHVGYLPGMEGGPSVDWANITTLQVLTSSGGKNTTLAYTPSAVKKIVDSQHHGAVAFEFSKNQAHGPAIPNDAKKATLVINGLFSPADVEYYTYPLPLNFSQQAAAYLFNGPAPMSGTIIGTVLTVFPLLGGMLVYFSPCFMEMTTVYIALISGIKISELEEKKSSKGIKLRILGSALLFVGGFALIYTSAGIVLGYGGQIMQGTVFDEISFPLRLVGGSVFVYMGLQSSGLLPKISWFKNSPLFPRVNQSCRTGGSFVVGLTFGCLQCFRGALVVAMLFFAFTLGSPVTGGLIMFLLAMAFGIPFIAIAFYAGRTNFLARFTPRTSRAFALGASVFLILLGISTILYDNHPLFNPIYYPVYYALRAWLGPTVPISPP